MYVRVRVLQAGAVFREARRPCAMCTKENGRRKAVRAAECACKDENRQEGRAQEVEGAVVCLGEADVSRVQVQGRRKLQCQDFARSRSDHLSSVTHNKLHQPPYAPQL